MFAAVISIDRLNQASSSPLVLQLLLQQQLLPTVHFVDLYMFICLSI